LPKIVAQTPIGKTVDVEVLHKGAKKTVQVAIGQLDDEEGPEDAQKPDDSKPTGPAAAVASVIGLKLSALTDEMRKKYGLDTKMTGVVIDDIDPDSPAAQKGIKPGDVIVEAGQDPVSKPDDVMRSIDKVKKAGRKAVLFRIEDGKGELRFVAVPVESEASPKQP